MRTALGVPLRRPAQVNASHAAARMGIAPVNTSADDECLSAFLSVRPRLFGIAYRMLGSAAEAEDIVQDVWVRWQTTDRSVVRDAPAFLATVTTRLAINVIQSARLRCETCAGPGVPDPVDTSADPGLAAERGEALQFAVLVLLEKLSPTERAAYVLREAFSYAYREIADDPSTRSSQHSPTGDPRAAACRRWPARAREFDRARAPSQGFHRRCPGRQPRRTGTSPCIGYRRQPGWLGGTRRPAGLSSGRSRANSPRPARESLQALAN